MIAILAVLTCTALVVLGYVAGAVRNSRRPSLNHREMARLIQRLIEQDNNFPVLPMKDRDEADELINDYFRIPPTKEIN